MSLTERQIKRRKDNVGASEVASILGLNPWESPYDLWLRRTGKVPPFEGNVATETGTILEGSLVDWFASKTGHRVRRGGEFRLADTPILVHTDARGDGFVVEAKSSGIINPWTVGEDWGEPDTDEIPDRVNVQVQTQLIASDRDIGHVVALLGGRGFIMYRVEANASLQRHIVVTVTEWFERYIVGDEEPPLTPPPSLDVIKRRDREPGKEVEVPSDIYRLAFEARARRLAAEKEEEAAVATLIGFLGDAEVGVTPDGDQFAYRLQSRRAIDQTLLRELHPDIAAEVTKETSHRVGRYKAAKVQRVIGGAS